MGAAKSQPLSSGGEVKSIRYREVHLRVVRVDEVDNFPSMLTGFLVWDVYLGNISYLPSYED